MDPYYLHAWDQVTPIDEVLTTLVDLVRQGKVRQVGLSDVPAWCWVVGDPGVGSK